MPDTERITFRHDARVTTDQFIDLLIRSGLSERRPTDDRPCIESMLEHADLIITAWDEDTLIGIARSVTDFSYCCYLSDLAVDRAFQRQGIGRQRVRHTQEHIGPRCKLILLSAPAASSYYTHLGFQQHPGA